MTTATLKRVLAEIRVAARETPRLYFSGVTDMTKFVGRVWSRASGHASTPAKAKPRPSGPSSNIGSSSLRHSKKNRQRAK